MRTNHVSTIFAIICLLIGLCTGANAQQGAQGGKRQNAAFRAEKMTLQLQNDLALTEVQTKQVAEINLRTSQQMEVINRDNTLNRQQRKMQMLNIQNKRKEEINALLNPEQQEKFQKHQLDRMSKNRGSMNKPSRRAARGGSTN